MTAYDPTAQAYMDLGSNRATNESLLANVGTNGLTPVDDPEKALSDISLAQYQEYIQNFQQFELDMLDRAQNDTSLIDQAYEDAPKTAEISQGIQQRNLSRYGQQLTPVQQQEMQRANQRGSALGLINSVANARIAQRESNQALMSDLINIGQGLNRSSLSGLGTSAQNQNQREQAYRNAQAQERTQNIGALGGLEHLPPQRLLLSRAINQLLSQVGRMGCRVFTRGTSETSASDVLILRQRPPGDPAGSNYVYRVDDRCMLCLSSVAECPNRVLVCGPNRVCPHGHTVCTECKHLRFATCPKCRAPL